MALKVITGGSISANYHVYFRAGGIPTSTTTGFTNQHTLTFREARDVPVETRDVRLTISGAFGSGSGSTTLAVDIGPGRSGDGFINLFSVSAPFTSVIPIQTDHMLRLRHTQTSAVAATNASIDAWVG